MLKSPLKISIDDIAIENMTFWIEIDNDIFKIRCTDFPFKELSSGIKKEKDRIKIAHYILTSEFFGIVGWNIERDNFLYPVLSEWLMPMYVDFDPDPNSKLWLHNFNLLESIQWHIIRHCIIDCFIGNRFIQGIISVVKMEELWKKFLTDVKCERWSTNFSNYSNPKDKKKAWEEEISYKDYYNISYGCYNCVNDHGPEKFIKCLSLLQDCRPKYLKLMFEWYKMTIQDMDRYEFYKIAHDVLPSGEVSWRRHLHINTNGGRTIHTFFISRSDSKYDVYTQIFDGTVSFKYQIKTSFSPVSVSKPYQTRKEAESFCQNEAPRRAIKKSGKINHKCHITKW